jgi:hypothetical protein
MRLLAHLQALLLLLLLLLLLQVQLMALRVAGPEIPAVSA